MTDQFYSECEYPFMMIPNQIWDIGLSGNEIAVFLRIFFRAGFKSECFESRASMAEACCLSEKTVSNCFAELERLNIVRIIRRQVENKPNLITINRPAKWLCKRNNFPKEGGPQGNFTQAPKENSPEAEVKITHVTIFPEQDSIKLNSLNTFPPAKAGAPQEPITELLTDNPKQKPEKTKTDGAHIFEAYADAYRRRYKLDPLRNAKVNSICTQIAKQLPLEEAKAVMHFYLQQNVSWYVQKGHAIDYALGDLQALRTNMLQNKAMSSRDAFLVDKQQSQKNTIDDYLANREQYRKKFIPE